jgi:predicted site-specific integrase-resolvase
VESILLLIVMIAGIAGGVWVVRTYHRPRTRAGMLEGSSFPPGTRAFEAEMSLRIIAQMIEARELELARSSDEAKKADLSRQLANLRAQGALHRATVEARDLSPGRMRIGVNPDSDTID